MSVMSMPGADDAPALADGPKRGGHELADGREEQGGVERPGRRRVDGPAHSAPSERANACASVSPGG